MGIRPYPTGLDWAWLASDEVGHVALFITAGVGPIPESSLSVSVADADVETLASTLPRTTNAKLFLPAPQPDSFVAPAERGIFVFDWSDVHRVSSKALNEYELVAAPAQPIKVQSLPAELARIAIGTMLNGLEFSCRNTIDVATATRCLTPSD